MFTYNLFSDYNFFQITLPEAASPLLYGIISLHDHIFIFLNVTLAFVIYLLFTTLKYFNNSTTAPFSKFSNNKLQLQNSALCTFSPKLVFNQFSAASLLEVVWTVVPSLILIFIAIPSFMLLYATDEVIDPSLTIKVLGHQWYWSYECNDHTFGECVGCQLPSGSATTQNQLATFIETNPLSLSSSKIDLTSSVFWESVDNKATLIELVNSDLFIKNPLDRPIKAAVNAFTKVPLEFDSYMQSDEDLQLGQPRLLETTHPLVLPKFTHIRFLVTSDDVIHSWAVPSLGIKIDAVPGRLNQVHTLIKKSGVFYGQCSELCGVNHAFMPIQILALEPGFYQQYMNNIAETI